MKTETKSYTIKYDGTLEIEPDDVPYYLLRGVQPGLIWVTRFNEDVTLFNERSSICIGLANNELDESKFDLGWKIPQDILDMDLSEYIRSLDTKKTDATIARIENELSEIKKRNLDSLFKAIIFVVRTFREKNIVWGVGRGSSCASYILFLLGLHMIDPIKYDIPMTEFFHD